MADKHVAPAWQLDAFHCPLCGVYARQTWERVYITARQTIGARHVVGASWRSARTASASQFGLRSA